jgi:hypothetical protein
MIVRGRSLPAEAAFMYETLGDVLEHTFASMARPRCSDFIAVRSSE